MATNLPEIRPGHDAGAVAAPDLHALFVYPTLTVGGAERHLALLVRALGRRGIASTILTLKHEGRFFLELAAEGFPVHYAAMSSRSDLRGARRAFAVARACAPDVLVTQSIDAQVIGHAIARRLGVPHVTIEHAGPGLRRALHRRILLRLVAPRIDHAIAITEAQISTLVAYGFRRDRMTVIRNGTIEPMPERDRDEMRAALGVDPDGLMALLVATLRPEKRAALFVDAVADARRRGARVVGVVAGGGPELELVRARAAQVGGTLVLGDRADVADLLAASDVVCLTSSVEGLPMIVLEAMALGRPVVSTAVGGVSEAVTAETGILVKRDSPDQLGEALAVLARDEDARRAMGLAGRARFSEQFTADRMADAFASTLRDVVARDVTIRARTSAPIGRHDTTKPSSGAPGGDARP